MQQAQQGEKYIAKYNKVWQRIKGGELIGRELVLKPDERLREYREVYAPKEQKQDAAKQKPQSEQAK